MQTRIVRLASERWNMPMENVVDVFNKYNIFEYIDAGYGIFHCEGDEAVFEDISELIQKKWEN